MTTLRFAVFATCFALVGAGCLGGGSKTPGDNGGVFVTSTGGAKWAQSVALPTAEGVSSIAGANSTVIELDPTDPTAVYLGTTQNGMLFSLDNGASWQRPEAASVRSGTIVDIEVDPRDVCTVYVLKQDRLSKTTTCNREYEDVYVQGTTEALTDMVIDWYNPNTLYVGTTNGDLLRTMDGGTTWTTIARLENITTLALSNADSRVLLLGTRSNGLYRSTDGGVSWTELEDAFDDFRNADRVYDLVQTADGTTVYMSTKYGIFSSNDNGATWKNIPLITAGSEVDITAIAVDPNDGTHLIYGTSSTLHHSDSSGSAWMTSALPTTRTATVLIISPQDRDSMMLGVLAVED